MSIKQAQKKNPITGFLPVIGFFVMVICGAIAWFASPMVADLVTDNFKQIPPGNEVRYISAVSVFFILIMIIAFIYALFAPKPTRLVASDVLEKEKRIKLVEEKDRRKAQRDMEAKRRKAARLEAEKLQKQKQKQ